MTLLLVVRLKGTVDVRSQAAEAMRRLGLLSKYSSTLVQDDPTTVGMLKVASTCLAWSKVDQETLTKILKARAKGPGGRPVTVEELKRAGFGSLEELAEKVLKGDVMWSKVPFLSHTFKLAPPRGGYPRPANRFYGAGGLLAENPDLPKLVERMI
jgi:large subunit ribosomal protein L30